MLLGRQVYGVKSAPSAKADLLRRAAMMHREAGNPRGALAALAELTKLDGVPDEVAGPAWYEYAEALLRGLETGVMEYAGKHYRQPPTAIRPAPFKSFRGRTYAAAVSPESAPSISLR